MNKKIAAAAIAAALSIGTLASVSTAHADSGHAKGVPSQVATVISGLVTKGTITQAQADAITAALTAAAPAKPDRPAIGMGGENRAAAEAVVTATLGITSADLQAARVAGKSLATLAGDKKAALITALVAFETKEIDAAVTAGTLTAAQATKVKADLTARVTAKVESVPGSKTEGMGKGMKMHGPDDDSAQPITPKTTTSLKKSSARPSIA
jgi:polyhydroxyalkanoate synthesis regulator phasin